MTKDVAVVGAGIGGLSTAIALSRAGWRVRVFERSSGMSETGAGIWIPPNAMQIFSFLGMAHAIQRSGVEILSAELRDYHGRVLQRVETKGSNGFSNVAIHRQTLQAILVEYAARAADIRYGHELVGVQQDHSRVLLEFLNGVRHEPDIAVGCDGIHSAVRESLFPEVHPRYSGQTSWRAVVHAQLPNEFSGRSIEIWAPGARFGCSRISENQVYWYATADAPEGGSETAEQAKARLLRRAALFPAPVGELVSATAPGAIIRTDLSDVPSLANWHQGRVVLLGDAAHATTPNLGQGAAQAVEDSCFLAQTLTSDEWRRTGTHSIREKEDEQSENGHPAGMASGKACSSRRHLPGIAKSCVLVHAEHGSKKTVRCSLQSTDIAPHLNMAYQACSSNWCCVTIPSLSLLHSAWPESRGRFSIARSDSGAWL